MGAPGAPAQVACACIMPDGAPMIDHTTCRTGLAGGFAKCCETAALPMIMKQCVGVAEPFVSTAAYAKVVLASDAYKAELKANHLKTNLLEKINRVGKLIATAPKKAPKKASSAMALSV